MKSKTIPLIASISLLVFGIGVFGFLGIHDKLLNLRFAQQHKELEPNSQSPVPVSKGTILLLLAVGVIGALSAHRKDKTSRSISETKSPQKLDNLKFNPFRMPVSMRCFGLGDSHVKTLDELRNAVCKDANFIILTGDFGIGNSTLIQCLKKEIWPEYIVIEIGNELQNAKDLFMLITDHIGINKDFKSKGAFFIHFNRYLHRVQAEGKKILIIVDDFTAINEKFIKELKFLSNITIRHQKIIKVLISVESISFSPDEPFKQTNSSVITCRPNRPKKSEVNSYTNYVSEKDRAKNITILFMIFKLFDQFINDVGKVKQWAIDGSAKVLARIHLFIKNEIKRLYIKTRNFWHTNFFISGLFDSLLWNSVLSASLFAIAFAFALWYQGILPIKQDVPKSDDFQEKYYSPDFDQENIHDIEIIKTSEQFNIRAKKQLSTDQKVSNVNRQNELQSKLLVNEPKSVEVNCYVQVGAFLIKENAIITLRKLKEKGYLAKIVTFTDSKDRLWHTVRIGEYSSLKVAKKHAAEFSNQEKMNSIVLPLKQN